jgi:uncharacterized protein (DUF2141 family)
LDDESYKGMRSCTKPRFLIYIFFVLTILFVPLLTKKVEAHGIVNVKGVENNTGHIILQIFETETSFKKFTPDRIYKKIATEGVTIIPLEDFHEGEVAIFVYHDENDDEKFNTSLFWTPKEGYAYSNSYIPTSIPKFSMALFTVEHGVPIDLNLIY